MSLIPDLVAELDEVRKRLQAAELRILRLPDGSVGPDQIADGAVGSSEIDWAQMPAVPVAQWINHSTVVGPALGYNMPTTGTWQSMASSWIYADTPSVLPARAGYVRRYSLRMQLVANTGSVAGINSAYWQFRASTGSTIWTTPTLYAGSAPSEVGWASAWIAATDWDPALGHLHLQILGQANTGFTSAVRHVQILGRYEPA